MIHETWVNGVLVESKTIDRDTPKTDTIRQRIAELGGWSALTAAQKDKILKILLGYGDSL